MLNEQKPEGVLSHAHTLEVHSIFQTIQGEGPLVGTPAVFIRLAGCNLQCPGCDTNYTSNRFIITIEALVHQVLEFDQPLAVITGGEPFRQNAVIRLAELLIARGIGVQIETNGTIFPLSLANSLNTVRYRIDPLQIICSPKTPRISKRLIPYINYYKYVIHADTICELDGLPSRSLGYQKRPFRPFDEDYFPTESIFVQPFDAGYDYANKRNTEAAVASCLRFGYRLSLQTHKIIGVD